MFSDTEEEFSDETMKEDRPELGPAEPLSHDLSGALASSQISASIILSPNTTVCPSFRNFSDWTLSSLQSKFFIDQTHTHTPAGGVLPLAEPCGGCGIDHKHQQQLFDFTLSLELITIHRENTHTLWLMLICVWTWRALILCSNWSFITTEGDIEGGRVTGPSLRRCHRGYRGWLWGDKQKSLSSIQVWTLTWCELLSVSTCNKHVMSLRSELMRPNIWINVLMHAPSQTNINPFKNVWKRHIHSEQTYRRVQLWATTLKPLRGEWDWWRCHTLKGTYSTIFNHLTLCWDVWGRLWSKFLLV